MYVSIYDLQSGWRAAADYQHTSSSLSVGTSWNINTTTSPTPTQTTRAVGSTASESGCGASWTGHHVHQIAGSFVLRSYPDHTTCNVDEAPVTNDVSDCWVGSGYKQGDITWQLFFP